MNVAVFAAELGLSVEVLLEQLHAAGVAKQNETDPISEHDKAQLLRHLRNARGVAKAKLKITETRRAMMPVKKASSTGRPHITQVDVRNISAATRLACNRTPARLLLTGRAIRTTTGPVLPVKMLSTVNVYDMFYTNGD